MTTIKQETVAPGQLWRPRSDDEIYPIFVVVKRLQFFKIYNDYAWLIAFVDERTNKLAMNCPVGWVITSKYERLV